MRILLLENDSPLAQFLSLRLRADQFTVDVAGDAAAAVNAICARAYDLVLVDMGLPCAGGVEVLHQIRAIKPSLLILLLTGAATPEDRIKGLDAGADDCMTKPLSYGELSARIRALLRRVNNSTNALLKVEDLELDRIGRTVRRGSNTIDLTQKEFALLEFLMQRPLQPMSRSMITEQAWKTNDDTMTNIVDVYINYLRKKIDFGFDRPLIRTVRGVGYQIGGSELPAKGLSSASTEATVSAGL